MRHILGLSLSALLGGSIFAIVEFGYPVQPAIGQSTPAITVSSSVPGELNPPFTSGPPSTGGAPAATPDQAAAFAWQEFIALNWPAGPQAGLPGQRDTPSSTCHFGDPDPACALLTWETFRSKIEIFPGNGIPGKVVPPPGYPGPTGDQSFGYDAAPPVYNYSTPIVACDKKQAGDPTPWINLDETDQITLDSMYAGVVKADSSPGNSSPQLIRFLAKANRSQYVYAAKNSSATDPSKQWWFAIPPDVVTRTKAYLAKYQASPPQDNSTMISIPDGTVEVKAGWRPLNPDEMTKGRFHMQMVRFYELAPDFTTCYRDAVWGLVSLHIIQKTPSAPYFIYATFEQADNILTSDGEKVEDADGNIILQPQPATATTPQVCLVDPQPPVTPPPAGGESTSSLGSVILTGDPTTCQPLQAANYCGAPGSSFSIATRIPALPTRPCSRLRETSASTGATRPIPDYVIAANKQAHAAITDYLQANKIDSAPWLAYKLVNVQYYPYDKIPDPNIPDGSPYTTQPPYTASNPAPSSYYQANIVVETNRSLQQFAGGLSLGGGGVSTQWNADGSLHKNTYYGGHFYNMGGCMGCHGSQGQNPQGRPAISASSWRGAEPPTRSRKRRLCRRPRA